MKIIHSGTNSVWGQQNKLPNHWCICIARFYLCSHQLPFLDTVLCLSHLLHYNLSDVQDIPRRLLAYFCLFLELVPLFQLASFRHIVFRSMHGSGLLFHPYPAIHNIEVAFNKALHRSWLLQCCSHTGIVHQVAKLNSMFNVVLHRSNCLLIAVSILWDCLNYLLWFYFQLLLFLQI